jgi:hypothetical protein
MVQPQAFAQITEQCGPAHAACQHCATVTLPAALYACFMLMFCHPLLLLLLLRVCAWYSDNGDGQLLGCAVTLE